ncbi:MAG: glycosyltransferase [Acidobacteriaceae bacterium]|jgi:rhamnosyltransferase
MSTIRETCLPFDWAVDRAQVAVVIPTINAKSVWASLSTGLRLQGIPASQVLIVDSSSNDGTRELARAEGYEVVRIDRNDFNHGGTRQSALDWVPWASIVVYLTQDAALATPDSLDHLLSAFEDKNVGVAYGRQLPRPGAGPIEAHARLFNYPPQSDIRDFESRHTLGIKATFLSNSFAAYRVDALLEVGGFPSDVIMAEDALVTGKLLLAGWKAAYVAEAQVYHSHAFTIAEEFRRYFDTGVYHRKEVWLRERFGNPAGEGKRFVMSELAFLTPRHLHLVPQALLRDVAKVIGYKLGLRQARLGAGWSRRLSYHKSYWDSPSAVQESDGRVSFSRL